jgi:hypothetical protein
LEQKQQHSRRSSCHGQDGDGTDQQPMSHLPTQPGRQDGGVKTQHRRTTED